ncbi:MAG: hypothetical protein Q8O38_09390 [Sulfurimicrobium sp.]|nr:hypothetical protein [Sulfurimicrobium sp.]
MMEERGKFEELSLLGGPLHRFGCRLGLVHGGTNTVALGLALGLIPWGVLVVLAVIESVGQQLFSLSAIGGHVRLLVLIPLFFLCESAVDPRVTAFVGTIVRSGVVPENALPALESAIARIVRWKDSWLPEAMCLLAAVLLSLIGTHMQLPGATATLEAGRALSDLPLVGQWYWIVCLTLFRFLMFRWLWRLGLWCYFLWRVSRLQLKLVPTHPDYAAGLGCLEVVQTHFTPLILAISAIQSASLAEEISRGAVAFEAIYPALALVLAVDAVLFLGPLFIFAPKLWACRIKGLSDYMEFASSYVNGFDQKWLGAGAHAREPLLGTADLQSLADLGNSINIVRNMRWVPMSLRLVKDFALAALLPILPLYLLKYPVAELAEKFFSRLTGL